MSAERRRLKYFHRLIEDGNNVAVVEWLESNKVTGKSYYIDARNCGLDSSVFRAVGLAAYHGHCHVIRTLIARGFDIQEMTFHYGFPECTPTHLACEKGHVTLVKMLVEEYGVDVNMDVYFSPLQWAVRYGQLEVVKYLLDAGAHNIDTKEDCPMFEDAADKKFPEILDFLVAQNPHIYTNPNYDDTPLHIAAGSGFVSTARELIDAGADVNCTDYMGETPFLVAVPHGKLDMLKFLLSKDADPEVRNLFGNSALHQAMMFSHSDIIHYLIEEVNVSVGTKNEEGESPLACLLKYHPVVDNKVLDILDLIVKAGHSPVEVVDLDKDVESTEWKKKLIQLQHIAFNPRRLKELSIFTMRRILGRNLVQGVDSLAIPQILKDAILLRD